MNVLLTSVGRRSYLVDYFKEALQSEGLVIATNTSPETTGMQSADIAIVVPPANNSQYTETLLNICKKYKIELVCSLHDWEAPYISKNSSIFIENGILPVLPKPEIIDICLDKYRTSLFADSLGIHTPKTYTKLEDAQNSIDRGEINFPLFIKPRWGQGSISNFVVNNKHELTCIYDLVRSKLENDGLSYLAGDNKEQQVLIQEFIEGQEYGVDIINDLNGNFVTCFVKKKLGMRAGETDTAETVHSPELYELSNKIANATKHLGNLDVDFFISNDDKIFLLEMNPRFGGGYPFSHVAGANIPAALVAWKKGEKADPSWLEVSYGVRCYKDIQLVTTS